MFVFDWFYKDSLVKKNMDVVNIQSLKNSKIQQQNLNDYKEYIQGLDLLEIKHEMDFLLNNIDLKEYDRAQFWKLDAIIHLLETRSSAGAARLIRKIREEIYTRVKDFYEIP